MDPPEPVKRSTQRRQIAGEVEPGTLGSEFFGELSESMALYLVAAIMELSGWAPWEPTTLGDNSLAKISSRSPKPRIAPWLSTRILSIIAKMLVLCVIKMTVRFSCLQASQRAEKCRFTICVQTGIGFVEDHQGRHPVECSRQTNSLPLPTREALSAITNLRVIAFRHGLNHRVHAGHLRRRNHHPFIDGLKAGDILGNRSGKQLDILGQIADVPSELLVVPVRQCGAINSNISVWTGQTPTMARARLDLPAALGPIMPRAEPVGSANDTPANTGRCVPGGATIIFCTES